MSHECEPIIFFPYKLVTERNVNSSSLALLLRAASQPRWFNWPGALLTVDIISVKCFCCFISSLCLIGCLCDNVRKGRKTGLYDKVDGQELRLPMWPILIPAGRYWGMLSSFWISLFNTYKLTDSQAPTFLFDSKLHQLHRVLNVPWYPPRRRVHILMDTHGKTTHTFMFASLRPLASPLLVLHWLLSLIHGVNYAVSSQIWMSGIVDTWINRLIYVWRRSHQLLQLYFGELSL